MIQFRKNSRMNIVYLMLRLDSGATPEELSKAINSTEANVRRMISELRIILTGHHEIAFENGIYYIK